jgi:hypothetical protein
MPVVSDPAIESFPVTDCDVIFGSGQKYSCTLRDGVDRLAVTETGWTITFAAPQEDVELYRAHVAMIAFRSRVQTRRLSPPPPAAPGVHGR